MKRHVFTLAIVSLAALSPAAERSHQLRVQILPNFAGAPLSFDSVTNTTAGGQSVSVTRLDFLLSDIGLRRVDGTRLSLTNWVAFISAREGRNRFTLEN